jgi:hypothetical protein
LTATVIVLYIAIFIMTLSATALTVRDARKEKENPWTDGTKDDPE